MNILSINTFYPFPPHRGMDIIYKNLLKAQSEAHEVTMLSMRRTGQEDSFLQDGLGVARDVHLVGRPQRSLPERVLRRGAFEVRSQLAWRPMATFYDTEAEFAEAAISLSRRKHFDIVEFHHSPCAGLARSVVGGAKVLYMYDVHYRSRARTASTREGLGKIGPMIEASKFRAFERKVVRDFDAVLFGQQADLEELNPYLRPGTVSALMPNIVDTDLFKPDDAVDKSNAVLFVGAMSHAANVDAITYFIRELWDTVRSHDESLELWIVGSAIPPEMQALDGARGIRIFPNVPDVKPYLHRARAYLAPLRIGSGVKVKIMEALAMGKAIVGSPVAVEGMGLVAGRDVKVAPLGSAFAEELVALLKDDQSRLSLERNARQAAIEGFGVARGRADLDQIYSRLTVSQPTI